jgi:putative FmdB family regulatory protein
VGDVPAGTLSIRGWSGIVMTCDARRYIIRVAMARRRAPKFHCQCVPISISFSAMPTYEFTCANGHDFEKFFRTISGGASVLPCPVCGLMATRKISAGAGLMFKGSGFYITDYGKDGKKDQNLPRKSASGDGASSAPSSESGGGSSDGGKESKSSGDAKSSGESKASDSKPAESKSASAESKGSDSKGGAAKPSESKPASPKSSSSSE